MSHRYDVRDVLREARRVFPATIVPDDFDAVEIPLPEHGAPLHRPGGGRAR
jgi:ribonuclease Z